eukprot:scaffold22163_cov53-Attheya_sp.AAC.1
MEATEQVSEPPAHYMTPTADTPDRQRYVPMRCCDCAAATLLLLNEDEDNWIRLHGKGTNGGKQDETVFWGNTKPVVVCPWRSRLAKEGGLNEEDNCWIRLHGSVQERGGVGGYLILAIVI